MVPCVGERQRFPPGAGPVLVGILALGFALLVLATPASAARFVAVGGIASLDSVVVRSDDGVTWSDDLDGLYGLHWANGLWVAVGDGGTVRTSTDGETWTPRPTGTTAALTDVTHGAG